MVPVVVAVCRVGDPLVVAVPGGTDDDRAFLFLVALEMGNTICYSLDSDSQSYHFLLPTGGSKNG
jgi:hypothetical protein